MIEHGAYPSQFPASESKLHSAAGVHAEIQAGVAVLHVTARSDGAGAMLTAPATIVQGPYPAQFGCVESRAHDCAGRHAVTHAALAVAHVVTRSDGAAGTVLFRSR